MRIPLDPAYPGPFDLNGPSFSALLRRLVPNAQESAAFAEPQARLPLDHVEGTTVLALTYQIGVVIAGDRRATSGNIISKRDMRKVFEADSWSAVAISGVAGPASELALVFATELEHYEKIEGNPLSLEGKSNMLARMVRANLPMALQGLIVVPLFAGFDPQHQMPRIYEFDAAGGRYEERRFAAQGSGGRDARGSLKARYRQGLSQDEGVAIALEALWDAADEDAATGGPDTVRGIYPLVSIIDAEGYRELPDSEVREHVEAIISRRS